MKRWHLLAGIVLLALVCVFARDVAAQGYSTSGYGSPGGYNSAGNGYASTWTPAQLPLIFWYRSDQGITIATGVSQWSDLSGNGRNATQPAGSVQPTYSATCGPSSLPCITTNGTSTYLFGSWTESQPVERYVVAKYTSAGTTGTLIDGFTLNTGRIYRSSATQLNVYAGAGLAMTGVATTSWNVLGALYDGSSSLAFLDGLQVASGNAGTSAPGGLRFANAAGLDYAAASYVEAIDAVGPLSATQRVQLQSYFRARYGASIPYFLVCDGNSFCAGNGASGASTYLGQQTLNGLSGFQASYLNNGVSGETTPQMLAYAQTHTFPMVQSTAYSRIVDLAVEGTNDLYFGASAATAYADTIAYCQAAHAAGLRVVVPTVLSRSNSGTPVGFNTQRHSYNSMLVANYSPCDAVVDWASNAQMGCDGCETNTTYFSGDDVHPNDTGYGVLGGLDATVISGL